MRERSGCSPHGTGGGLGAPGVTAQPLRVLLAVGRCERCRPPRCRAELGLPSACALPKQRLELLRERERAPKSDGGWCILSIPSGGDRAAPAGCPAGGQHPAITGSSTRGCCQCITP